MRRSFRSLLLVVLPALSACAESATGTGTRGLLSDSTSQFLACPSALPAVSATGTIGALGGVLTAGPLRLEVPAGAVTLPTLFELVVPPSPYMEVQLHAVGVERFVFEQPVTVTLDYSRCPSATGPAGAPLKVVHVAPLTRAVLEDMGGEVNPGTRTIRFSTGHFSSYVVAY